jgi:hypothetical protein
LAMNEAIFSKLEQRLGRLHAKLRLGIETDHEAQIFGQRINFFHIENWYSVHSVIRTTPLKLSSSSLAPCKFLIPPLTSALNRMRAPRDKPLGFCGEACRGFTALT